MRYLFRGLIRDTARPVEGHVEADAEDAAYAALATNGVVTESLVPDPSPLNLNEELPKAPEFADALESAFDSSSSQVDFDALTERYRGKKVWVIDRDKIRRRVAQVVDAALALSMQHGEGAGKTRERIANAITAMFADNTNIASERNAESIAGVRFNGGAAADRPPAPTAVNFSQGVGGMEGGAGHAGLETQIARLGNLVRQAEATLAAIGAAARRGGGGGGGGGDGPRRRSFAPAAGRGDEQNAVLLEIFKSNLELVRNMQDPQGAVVATADGNLPITSSMPAEPQAQLETASLESGDLETGDPETDEQVSPGDLPEPTTPAQESARHDE